GELFVQGRVRVRDATGRFDDVVGRGWTLVSPFADPAVHLEPEAAAFFASLGGITAHVGAQANVRDLDATYRRWFDGAGVAVVLQRPDFYVFGTARSVEDTSALVEALRRALAR